MTKRIDKVIAITLILAISIFGFLCLGGCDQAIAKNFGGTTTLDLEEGQKLEMITWKDDDSLWYLTRDRHPDESPETYYFRQSSEFGVIEGTVEIVEH